MRTGRPRERAITLRDGFYIEIYNSGEGKGLKLRSETEEAMELAAKQYSRFKKVVILGEYKNGVKQVGEKAWLNNYRAILFIDSPVYWNINL